MERVILFGAGQFCKRYCEFFGDKNLVIAVADNKDRLWKKGAVFGHLIICPDQILSFDFDRIVICINDVHKTGQIHSQQILTQLLDLGINETKISMHKLRYPPNDPRVTFLREYSRSLPPSVEGNVAECGVFRGDFAAHINECFPQNKLYLFDSFKGFNKKDIDLEQHKEMIEWFNSYGEEYSEYGSERFTLLRCDYRDQVIIRKGFVPETFAGLENEKFIFVNLDMDVYAPTLEALRFFAPRMDKQGIILLHDYFWQGAKGIKQAVDEFSLEYAFIRLPIGDNASIALKFI